MTTFGQLIESLDEKSLNYVPKGHHHTAVDVAGFPEDIDDFVKIAKKNKLNPKIVGNHGGGYPVIGIHHKDKSHILSFLHKNYDDEFDSEDIHKKV